MNIRTDLAYEAYTAHEAEAIPGVSVNEERHKLFGIHKVTISSSEGERRLGKPSGHYTTLEIASHYRYDPSGFQTILQAISKITSDYIPKSGSCLIAGLGNAAITADAIGPGVLQKLFITRHLQKSLPEPFNSLRPVSAVAPGVLGTTGIESGDIIHAIIEYIHPKFLVVIDSLAAGSSARLLNTIQFCDTGLVPGSGIGNARASLTPENLGVPVIAIGVPTVIYADTLLSEAESDGNSDLHRLVVTPKEIDQAIRNLSKLIGYGLNLSLHPTLSQADLEHLLS